MVQSHRMLLVGALLIASALASSIHLPVKTLSGVCPAVQFSHSWMEANGQFGIQFRPDNQFPFEWVDVHVVLEDQYGTLIGLPRNYKMASAQGMGGPGLQGQGVWTAFLEDPQHIAAARQRDPERVLKYSFTYCVGVNGRPVDCDTDAFPFEVFEWRAGQFPPCPMECGLTSPSVSRNVECIEVWSGRLDHSGLRCQPHLRPQDTMRCPFTEACVTFDFRQSVVDCPQECGLLESWIPARVRCVGSDGVEYPMENCANLPRPSPHFCPATPSCVTYNWEPMAVSCPTDCGFLGSQIVPKAVCMGSDFKVYGDQYCANLPFPSPVTCNPTQPCVVYSWQASEVICPKYCDYSGEYVTPEAICVGNYGSVYPSINCAQLPRPMAVQCPATQPCETFYWKPAPVICPKACGLPSSQQLPDTVCMGITGSVYPANNCANLPRPSATACPATEPCETYFWQESPVVCPTACGLLSSQQLPDSVCMALSGGMRSGDYCANLPRPSAINCPATQPCESYSWSAMPVVCPKACGLPYSEILPDVVCMGSFGSVYSADFCAHLPRPPAVSCPATVPCETYFWQESPVVCPTTCGLLSSQQLPDVVCVGTNGGSSVYTADFCSHLPRPQAVICPATELCETYYWKPTPYVCPTICGLPYSEHGEAVCMGTLGGAYPAEYCANQPRPAPMTCPATEPCETFYWEAAPVVCPDSCGLLGSQHVPDAICLGTDGGMRPADLCAHLPRPPAFSCPATMPCETYSWSAMTVQCPMACGLPSSEILPDVVCVGSTGSVHPANFCARFPRPPAVFCPATAPCETYFWQESPVVCPVMCGLLSSEQLPDVVCIGSNGGVYTADFCAHLPLPQTVFCPATQPCETYYWKPTPYVCPTMCGLPFSEHVQDAVCMGTTGSVYPGDYCANSVRPPAITCPATHPCETFYWKAAPVVCPKICGLPASQQLPDAVCVGTTGSIADGSQCAHLPRPALVQCPATMPCVDFEWSAGLYECPTACGLQASVHTPPVLCRGSDGMLYPDAHCSMYPRPTVQCPGTAPCITYDWQAGLVECPTQCGLPASTVQPPVKCMGSDFSATYDELCDLEVRPTPVRCPATPPCPLPPLHGKCPAIEYSHHVSPTGPGGSYTVVFVPLGQGINRRLFEFVDVHIWVEDINGQRVGADQNLRMTRPLPSSAFQFSRTITIELPFINGARTMVYSFTYCVDKIDCDTQRYYYQL